MSVIGGGVKKQNKNVWNSNSDFLKTHGGISILAAMSSSRSDFVTQFVCMCVCPSLFFSFSVLEVSSSPKESQWCFKTVQSLKEVSRMFQRSF